MPHEQDTTRMTPTIPANLPSPFTRETAILKVRKAEGGWNSRNPEQVALAYSIDSQWRNRSEFLAGRDAIVAFLIRKWSNELEYRLIKELWAFHENRIAVRSAYESHDASGQWYRSYGNENREFDEHGLMKRRLQASMTANPGVGACVSLADRPPPGLSSGVERTRSSGVPWSRSSRLLRPKKPVARNRIC
jgi:nuclear transport factor 2 (NTF2) superfamily protein